MPLTSVVAMGKRHKPAPIAEDALARVAHILGPSSGAAKALDDIRQRRAKGEAPQCWVIGNTYFVVPADTGGDRG